MRNRGLGEKREGRKAKREGRAFVKGMGSIVGAKQAAAMRENESGDNGTRNLKS